MVHAPALARIPALVLALVSVITAFQGPGLHVVDSARADLTQTMGAQLPTARDETSSVWTGQFAYVFGGRLNSGMTNQIVRYDPSTDTQTTLGATLPSARRCTTAVWTGTRAYIIGGANSAGTNLRSVVTFNPSTNTVEGEQANLLPEGRNCAVAVWTGTEAYIFGGCCDSLGDYHTRILKFVPPSTVTTLAQSSNQYGALKKCCLAAVWDPAVEKAYIIGGESNSGLPSNQIVEWDKAQNRATVLSTTLPSGRIFPGLAWDGSSRLAYIFGGTNAGTYYDQILKFTASSRTITTQAATLPSGRAMTSAIWSGMYGYVFGGTAAGAGMTRDIVRYDPLNQDPIASIGGSVSDHTFNGDASLSSDPEHQQLTYFWDWGDGTTTNSGTNAFASHTYAMAGTYGVVLTVTDPEGATDQTGAVVETNNYAPTAQIGAPTINVRTVGVDGSTSSDSDGTISQYTWNWGDGTANTVSSLPTASHTYTLAGTYTVTLTVRDNLQATDSETRQIVTGNTPPTASFTTTINHVTLSVNGAASSDVDGSVSNYLWDWGDGQQTNSGGTSTSQHTYSAVGPFTVRLTVTDNLGSPGTSTKSVTLDQRTPIACFTVTSTNAVRLQVSGTCSSDPDGDPITEYRWTWGDGSIETYGATQTHDYACTGANPQFNVRLTVRDSLDGSSFVERAVQLDNVDADGDGVVKCREALQGTLDTSADTDADGLSDLVESQWWVDVVGAAHRDAVFCHQGTCADPHPTQRDVYAELDWMSGHPLDATERGRITDAWANSPMNTDGNPNNDIHFVVDTGQLGGGGSVIPFDQYTSDAERDQIRQANLRPERVGIYRYGVIACRYLYAPNDVVGFGEAPGDDFTFFDCMPNMADAEAQAKEFMHELGHTLLGLNIQNRAACQNVERPEGSGQSLNLRDNDALGHFNEGATAIDCNGDTFHDAFDHPHNSADVMNIGGPTGKTVHTYATNTWNGLRLDFGVNGAVVNDGCSTLLRNTLPASFWESIPDEHRTIVATLESQLFIGCNR